MAINIHPILFTTISPIKFLQPLLGSPLWYGASLQSKLFLHVRCCHIVHYILHSDKSILSLLHQMPLYILRSVFMIKNWCVGLALSMCWQFSRGQELMDPTADAPCSLPSILNTQSKWFNNHNRYLPPWILELSIQVQVEGADHWGDLQMKDKIEFWIACLDTEVCSCMP